MAQVSRDLGTTTQHGLECTTKGFPGQANEPMPMTPCLHCNPCNLCHETFASQLSQTASRKAYRIHMACVGANVWESSVNKGCRGETP